MRINCVRRSVLRHRTRIVIVLVLWIAIGIIAHQILDQAYDVRDNGQLLLDRSSVNTEFELASRIQAAMPNLPTVFLLRHRYPRRRWNGTCAYLPFLFDIRLNQKYWQHVWMKRSGFNLYLYAAYYDNRVLVPATGGQSTAAPPTFTTHVRLLAMIDRHFKGKAPAALCQFWRDNSNEPVFSGQASFDFAWTLKWGFEEDTLLPVLVSCPVPKGTHIPRVVSLVEQQCDNATNALYVQHSRSAERRVPSSNSSFAVCVKGFAFQDRDLSVRLIEWLELLRQVGADRVFLYELVVHPNMSRVLRHYVASGFVDLTPLTLAGDQTSNPDLLTLYFRTKVVRKRQNEIIPYNDCLYRNLYRYRYVVLMDIDEAIIPTKAYHRTWKEMLIDATAPKPAYGITKSTATSQETSLYKKDGNMDKFSSLCTRHVYFFDNVTSRADGDVGNMADVPEYMHMLRHVVRTINHTKVNFFTKCFHSTLRVLTLHNHLPISCLPAKCEVFSIPTTSGHLQHYRHGCTYGAENECSDTSLRDSVADKSIWKYKTELIGRVETVLRLLGFISTA